MWLMTVSVGLLTLVMVTWLRDYVKRRQMPPGPFFWPVIGNPFLFRGQFYYTFIELAKKYGDVFSLKFGMNDVVVLNSAEAVRDAFVKKSVEFAGRPKMLSNDIPSEGGKSIIAADYTPTWKLHRKLFHRAVRDYALGENLETKVRESLKDIIAEFSSMEGKPVDPEHHLHKLVYNVMCSAASGVRYNMEDKEFKDIIKVSEEFGEVSAQGFFADVYPSWRFLPTPAKSAAYRTRDRGVAILQRHVEQHRETFDPNNLRDIIDHMIKAQKDAEEEGIHDVNSLTDTHLRQTISNIMIAGAETTIATLQWAVLYLAAHREIQDNMAAELDSVVGRDRLPELVDQENTPYTEATIREVMRMSSIAPTADFHCATVDTTLRGYQIPKGTWVIPNLWAVHHDPATWGDPDVFRPERFLDEDGKILPKPMALMPFSAGRRICPGEALGKADTFLLLAGLAQNFSFRLPRGKRVPEFSPADYGGGDECIPYTYKVVMACRK